MPGLLDLPVEQIIAEQCTAGAIVKFVISTANVREQAMSALYSMNITNATLFPDVDGLARSLAYELEFHWAFDPKTNTAFPGYHTVPGITQIDCLYRRHEWQKIQRRLLSAYKEAHA